MKPQIFTAGWSANSSRQRHRSRRILPAHSELVYNPHLPKIDSLHHFTKYSCLSTPVTSFSPDSLSPTMVVSLGPGKFYGTSLPRPRIYNDVKFNDHRVDPPVPVTDPLMSWACEAHWSMGGLSFKRLRLQGKIEGNVNKLRAEREKLFKKLNRSPVAASIPFGSKNENVVGSKRGSSVSPPPAPVVSKRRKFLAMIKEGNEEEEESPEEEEVETVNRRVRRRLVKKLGDDFDKVALASERSCVSDSGNRGKKGSPLKSSPDRSDSMASRTRSRKLEKGGDEVDDIAMKEVEGANKSNSKGKKVEKNTTSRGYHSPVSCKRVRTSPRWSKWSVS